MERIFLGNFKVCLQAALFFGVLNALLFSTGEGIRLFPFPASEIGKIEKSFLKDGKKTPYNKNIFRFEKGESNSFSKFQRNAKDFWAGDFAFSQNSPLFKSPVSFNFNFLQSPSIFKSRINSLSKGSRAPPIS